MTQNGFIITNNKCYKIIRMYIVTESNHGMSIIFYVEIIFIVIYLFSMLFFLIGYLNLLFRELAFHSPVYFSIGVFVFF